MQVMRPANQVGVADRVSRLDVKPDGEGDLRSRKATPLDEHLKEKAKAKEDRLDPKIKWLIVALVVVGICSLGVGVTFGLARLNPGIAKSLRLDGVSTSTLKAVEISSSLGGLASLLGASYLYYRFVSLPKYNKMMNEMKLNQLFNNKAFQDFVAGVDINRELQIAKNKNPNLLEVPGRLDKLNQIGEQYDGVSDSFREGIQRYLELVKTLSDNIAPRVPEKIPLENQDQKRELQEAMRTLNDATHEIAGMIDALKEQYIIPFKQHILDFLFNPQEPSLAPMESLVGQYRDHTEKLHQIVNRYRSAQETYIRFVTPHLSESLT